MEPHGNFGKDSRGTARLERPGESEGDKEGNSFRNAYTKETKETKAPPRWLSPDAHNWLRFLARSQLKLPRPPIARGAAARSDDVPR